MTEAEKIYARLDHSYLVSNSSEVDANIKSYVENYEGICAVLIEMVTTAAYWGSEQVIETIVKIVEWLGNPPNENQQGGTWTQIRRYPALLIIYSAGIALFLKRDFRGLNKLFFEPNNHDRFKAREKLLLALHPYQIIEKSHMNTMYDKNYRVPISERLFSLLPSRFSTITPNRETFGLAFNEFEYLFCLAFAKEYFRERNRIWGPVGRFVYLENSLDRLEIPDRIAKDITAEELKIFLGIADNEELLDLLKGFNEFVYAVFNKNW